MRINRLICAIGIGCTLCACSSKDEPGVQEEQKDYTKSNKYVSVSIVTASGSNTRAGEDEYDPFDDGDEKEYDVNGVGFYFFDRQGACVDTEYIKSTDFKKDGASQSNPATTVVATVEVELVANRVYDSMIAILNPNNSLFSHDSPNELTKINKDNIAKYYANYSGDRTLGEKGNFTMSNSVFVDVENYSGEGSQPSYMAVPISSSNIYTKNKKEEDMTTAELNELNSLREEKAINVYVERVCSKVIVKNTPSFSTHYVDAEGTTNIISVMDQNNGQSVAVDIQVVPVFKGMGLSVTSKNAYLLKNLNGLTYDFGGSVNGFVWNDPLNKRSYWEKTIGNSDSNGKGYNYTAWNALSASTLKQYINPNTDDATLYDNDVADKSTKLLVCAQLIDKTTEKPIDLVKFSGGYWKADYLIFHAATRAMENLAVLSYEGLESGEIEPAKSAVEKITRKAIEDNIVLSKKSTGSKEAYLAKLTLRVDGQGNEPDFLAAETDLDATLKAKVSELVNSVINNTLMDISNRQIQYWKDGMTYFYVPIRHEGFTGLEGGDQGNYLNGVVRNHVYQIKISKIWGLGTPVIDPEEPIDPERPNDAPDSYMSAKIHVLKWRVVDSSLTLH